MKFFKTMKDCFMLANAARKGKKIITHEDGSYSITINS